MTLPVPLRLASIAPTPGGGVQAKGMAKPTAVADPVNEEAAIVATASAELGLLPTAKTKSKQPGQN